MILKMLCCIPRVGVLNMAFFLHNPVGEFELTGRIPNARGLGLPRGTELSEILLSISFLAGQ